MAEDDKLSAMTGVLAAGAPLPRVSIPKSRVVLDGATVFGIVLSIALIAWAIAMGNSDASFFDLPSVLIVVFGTLTSTAISYTGEELVRAGNVISKSVLRRVYRPNALARALLELSVVAKKKGVLALTTLENELSKEPQISRGIQMAIDGGKPQDIDYILSQETAALIDRHKRIASITKRAAEIAPAMGLIGTLVGLVQMLANLENPDTIGPAMAVALLTTFYGAVIGTVIMAPLAVKLEKNSQDEALVRTLIRLTSVSIARQDNPRKLEMELNAALPPLDQIRYFD